MDFLKETLSSRSGHKPSNQPEQQTNPHRQPSTSELMSSAKVVAGAAKATLGRKTDEVDKGKVAGAAGDLLGAAKHYGKLEGTGGVGKYVSQAETYLQKYESSHSGGASTAAAGAEGKKKKDEHGGGSGAADYFKMAEGFLKK